MSKKYVNKEIGQEIHSKAEPFIKWLKEADEEETDSEDEEDPVEVRCWLIRLGRICSERALGPTVFNLS